MVKSTSHASVPKRSVRLFSNFSGAAGTRVAVQCVADGKGYPRLQCAQAHQRQEGSQAAVPIFCGYRKNKYHGEKIAKNGIVPLIAIAVEP